MIDLVNFVSNFFELGSHFAYRSFSAVEIYSQEASQQSRSTHKGSAAALLAILPMSQRVFYARERGEREKGVRAGRQSHRRLKPQAQFFQSKRAFSIIREMRQSNWSESKLLHCIDRPFHTPANPPECIGFIQYLRFVPYDIERTSGTSCATLALPPLFWRHRTACLSSLPRTSQPTAIRATGMKSSCSPSAKISNQAAPVLLLLIPP